MAGLWFAVAKLDVGVKGLLPFVISNRQLNLFKRVSTRLVIHAQIEQHYLSVSSSFISGGIKNVSRLVFNEETKTNIAAMIRQSTP